MGKKVANTLGKISDVGNKLLRMAETAGTTLGYGSEIVCFGTATKGLDIMQDLLLIDYVTKVDLFKAAASHQLKYNRNMIIWMFII